MDAKERKDTINETALAVVEAQQTVVGAGVLGAGVATLNTTTDKNSGILEQIRDFSEKSLTSIRKAVTVFTELLTFDKEQARLVREQSAEKAKEDFIGPKLPSKTGDATIGDVLKDENLSAANKIGALSFLGNFLGRLPGVGLMKKILSPIGKFFGKGGLLFKIFGRFGPLAVLGAGIFLVARYADDIAKAFAPVIDKLKELVVKLTPFFKDVLMPFVDFIFKNLIQGLANVFEFIINSVTKVIDGFKKIFVEGDIMGGFSDLFEGLLRFIFAIPLMVLNFIKPLFVNTVKFFEESFQNFAQGVRDFFSNIFSAIGNFAKSAFELYVSFIKMIYMAPVKFFSFIFDTISSIYGKVFKVVDEFLGGIPSKILGFVFGMFEPIIGFFKKIGNSIKSAINGIIDALPLPEFVKKKIRFNIEPKQEDLDKIEAEVEQGDGKINIKRDLGDFTIAKGVLQDDSGNNAVLSETEAMKSAAILTQATGDPYQSIKTDKGFMVMNPENPLLPEDIQPVKIEKAAPIITQESVPQIDGSGGGAMFVNQPITKIDNSSSNSQNSISTGKLQIAIDPYHDRNAFQGVV
tara:strand:+ start:434 stop:2164 length:1731 start_codon:yes stop_codon:yes gene_type:complete